MNYLQVIFFVLIACFEGHSLGGGCVKNVFVNFLFLVLFNAFANMPLSYSIFASIILSLFLYVYNRSDVMDLNCKTSCEIVVDWLNLEQLKLFSSHF